MQIWVLDIALSVSEGLRWHVLQGVWLNIRFKLDVYVVQQNSIFDVSIYIYNYMILITLKISQNHFDHFKINSLRTNWYTIVYCLDIYDEIGCFWPTVQPKLLPSLVFPTFWRPLNNLATSSWAVEITGEIGCPCRFYGGKTNRFDFGKSNVCL